MVSSKDPTLVRQKQRSYRLRKASIDFVKFFPGETSEHRLGRLAFTVFRIHHAIPDPAQDSEYLHAIKTSPFEVSQRQ
jgi:hypothetical protein